LYGLKRLSKLGLGRTKLGEKKHHTMMILTWIQKMIVLKVYALYSATTITVIAITQQG
jgi:hypothetical protein